MVYVYPLFSGPGYQSLLRSYQHTNNTGSLAVRNMANFLRDHPFPRGTLMSDVIETPLPFKITISDRDYYTQYGEVF